MTDRRGRTLTAVLSIVLLTIAAGCDGRAATAAPSAPRPSAAAPVPAGTAVVAIDGTRHDLTVTECITEPRHIDNDGDVAPIVDGELLFSATADGRATDGTPLLLEIGRLTVLSDEPADIVTLYQGDRYDPDRQWQYQAGETFPDDGGAATRLTIDLPTAKIDAAFAATASASEPDGSTQADVSIDLTCPTPSPRSTPS